MILEKSFTNGMFNITCRVKKNMESIASYNDVNKKIYIDIYKFNKSYGIEHWRKEVKEILAHELTHFFDYNCWKSWCYKDDNVVEHLATFCQAFHKPTEEFSKMMLKWLEDKFYNEDKKEDSKDGEH
jgi:hypothetical protein